MELQEYEQAYYQVRDEVMTSLPDDVYEENFDED